MIPVRLDEEEPVENRMSPTAFADELRELRRMAKHQWVKSICEFDDERMKRWRCVAEQLEICLRALEGMER